MIRPVGHFVMDFGNTIQFENLMANHNQPASARFMFARSLKSDRDIPGDHWWMALYGGNLPGSMMTMRFRLDQWIASISPSIVGQRIPVIYSTEEENVKLPHLIPYQFFATFDAARRMYKKAEDQPFTIERNLNHER